MYNPLINLAIGVPFGYVTGLYASRIRNKFVRWVIYLMAFVLLWALGIIAEIALFKAFVGAGLPTMMNVGIGACVGLIWGARKGSKR